MRIHRRLFVVCAALLALVLAAAPASAGQWPHWSRPAGQQVRVEFERTRVSDRVWAQVKVAVADWSRSGRVDGVPVATCRNRRSYCVQVTEYSARDGRGGLTLLNHDPKTNIAWYGSLKLNTYYLRSSAQLAKGACHEAGHAFGAEHRTTGATCMRDGLGTLYRHPDSGDFALLQKLYARPGQ